jgi:hypothetical protein
MASKTDICNLALLRIGVSQSLNNVDTDGTREALSSLVLFNTERDFVLRDFPWQRARAFATPTLATNFANPANTDWTYAYRMPADALFIRRILTANGRQDINPPAFAIGRDPAFGTAAAWNSGTAYVVGNLVIQASVVYECILGHTNHQPPNATYWRVVSNDQLIFSDTNPATFEYTAQLTDPTQFEAEFISMFAWKLGAGLAWALSRTQDMAKTCLEMYALEKKQAEDRAALEAQKDVPVAITDATTQEIVNLALLRLGVTRDTAPKSLALVASEAQYAAIAFNRERDFVLRDFPWPWATAYADPVQFAGDSKAPFTKDWIYAFKCPADCVVVRRIVNPLERRGNFQARRFQYGGDAMWPVPYKVIAGAFGLIGISSNNVSPNDTITITGQAYTFVTSLSGAGFEVLIGPDPQTTALHLTEAINGPGPMIGTDYGNGTTANSGVMASFDGGVSAFDQILSTSTSWAAVITVLGLQGLSVSWSKSSNNILLAPPASFGDVVIGGSGALLATRLILTNEPSITIEYTRAASGLAAEWDAADRVFSSMLGWRVAAALAPSRIADPKLADQRQKSALAAYFLEKSQAQSAALREGQQQEPLEAEWIRGR